MQSFLVDIAIIFGLLLLYCDSSQNRTIKLQMDKMN
jgi:hypothetical protein